MTELDIKIKDIFIKLVNSGTKYLKEVSHYHNKMIYNINGLEITLYMTNSNQNNEYTSVMDFFKGGLTCWFDYAKEFSEDTTKFVLVIGSKPYFVSKFHRIEKAEILSKIEATINEYEESILNKISEEL